MKTGGQFFASGTEGCVCSTNVVNGVSMQIYPTVYDLSSDDAMKDTGFYRTVHEYVHVWQSMAAGSAGWLMEGTAVFTECVMGLKHLQQDWKGCLEQLGGGGGILRNARKMVSYAVSDGFGVTASDWLKIYGEFRPKAGEELDMLEKSNPSVLGGGPGLGRMVYYDLGAAAVAFAITKHVGLVADASVTDFYRVFYPSIEPVDDMQFVGDGQGWKKALLDFTGLRSMDDFYEELTMWLELPDGPMWTVLENGGLGAAAVSAALANGTYAPPSDQEWPMVSVVEATCAPAPGSVPGAVGRGRRGLRRIGRPRDMRGAGRRGLLRRPAVHRGHGADDGVRRRRLRRRHAWRGRRHGAGPRDRRPLRGQGGGVRGGEGG